jgi:tetratricopeptide (TPR) repeat protein
MRCAACGHENRSDAAFCADCGARLVSGAVCPRCGRGVRPGQRFCDGCGEGLLAAGEEAAVRTTIADAPVSFVSGRYRVVRLLGQGSHKRVYLAHDTLLDRQVAFVLIRAEALDPGIVERVRREAQAMGRLPVHPNVVTVHDAGEERGFPYIVEEYVDGGTVADLLAQPGSSPQPLSVERALRIASDVSAALDHAHGHGIIHRDVKPANVWLTSSGTAKLGDFGLVAAVRESHSSRLAKLTGEGMMVGTIAYMAPEQALGEQVDARADLYALGAMLYELVTARPPFAGDEPLAIVSQHLRSPPVAPALRTAAIPGPLNELILQLLAKDPRDRPQSADAVHAALSAISSQIAGAGPPAVDAKTGPQQVLAAGVFVDREQELDDLCSAVDRALGGHGDMVLLAGPAGIGKTRLVEQLTTYANLRDALVLWGRCDVGEGAPSYWPWVQVIRAYTVDHDPDALWELMGGGAADIAALVSEVRRRLPNLPEPPSLEGEQARFRLFDSVSTFLVNASRSEPLVLVLDDLHAADRGSLLLVEFLAHQVADARLLLVGTYRDDQLHDGHPLMRTLGELARVRSPRRVTLEGLSDVEVARYIEITTGVPPDDRLVAAVHAKSEGNPFYVAEIVRLLAERARLEQRWSNAAEVTIPSEVRDVIRRRLEQLTQPCRDALTTAAVIGRSFRLRVLQELVDLLAERLLEALDEAVAAHVVEEVAPGEYQFSQGVIWDTLYDSIPKGRRLRLHYRVATTLEEVFAGNLEPRLGEIAHHLLEAGDAGDLEQALRYGTAAAAHAAQRLAHEEAARLYERTLAAMDVAAADGERRCDLLLALGDSHARAGSTAEARAAFGEAADLARRLRLPQRLARAAVELGGPRPTFGVVDQEHVALLEEALGTLGDADGALRARLLARLAMELYFGADQKRRAMLIDEAAQAARGADDPATLAYVLNARYAALWGAENVQERLAIADEVIDLAERAGDPELKCEGHSRRAVALLELAQLDAAIAAIDAHRRLAEELRQPLALWQAMVWRATLALLVGRFADAETAAEEALAYGRRLRFDDAESVFAVQAVAAKQESGRLEDLPTMIGQLRERLPATRFDVALAYAYAELGRREDATAVFETAVARGFGGNEHDSHWLPSTAALGDVCAFLGDERRAAAFYELLLPYAGQNIVAVEGWFCYGSADRVLGVLAATMHQWEIAEAHFEAAVALNTQIRARPWLARTYLAYAEILLARHAPGDVNRARSLLAQALDIARELGMSVVAGRIDAQLAATAT